RRAAGGLAIMADGLATDQLVDAYVGRAIAGVLAQCSAAIQSGTTRRTKWVIARSIGGDDECEPIEIEDRTPAAEELGRVAARIRDWLTLLARTDALRTAARIIAEHRWRDRQSTALY